jgi:hypothetical protein
LKDNEVAPMKKCSKLIRRQTLKFSFDRHAFLNRFPNNDATVNLL